MFKRVRKLYNPFDEAGPVINRRSSGLEWDEAIIDSTSDVDEQVEQNPGDFNARLFMLFGFLALFVLFSRIFYLQIARGEYYKAISEGNRTRKLTLLAPRGLILDKYGKNLVTNSASFNLVLIPFDLPKDNLSEIIDLVSKSFSLDKAKLVSQIEKTNKKSFQPITVKNNLTQEEILLFQTQEKKYPGFSIMTVPVRNYLNPEIYSHLIGYTNVISEKELAAYGEDNYEPIDIVGKSGIELVYENFLKGQNGKEQIEVDATGKLTKDVGEVSPKTGNTLTLSIDKDLQEELYKYFSVGKGGAKGAAIAMDPSTGEILALVSLPGYDINLFAHGISEEDYSKLLKDKSLPLFNRAIAGVYPPGSTVKTMHALAGLEEGLITENTKVDDKGKLVIANQYNSSITYDFVGWKLDGLGVVDVRRSIALSSDIFFYILAGGHPSSPIKPLGIEKLSEWYRKFHLGKPTGVDLVGEKSGTVADPAWKAQYYKKDPIMAKWYLGDTYHVGIGQGDMLVTPLQTLVWTATLANNGVGMKPRILKNVKDASGKIIYESKPEVLIPKVGSDKNIAIVNQGSRDTVVYGSARQLADLPIECGGKTGTSQFDGSDPNKTHAWFTAFCPMDNPKIALVVLVEAGGGGNAVAVPIAKNLFKWWALNRYNK